MNRIVIVIIVVIFCGWFLFSKKSKEGVTFRIPEGRYNAGMPVYRLSEDAIKSAKYNINTGWYPATHMKTPSFAECQKYALSLGGGKWTDLGYTKLAECVTGSSMKPWIKNLPVQDFVLE
jgi:hypothetical protein